MVVQPLFRKLNSENILHRAYYKDGNRLPIVIELARKTIPYYSITNESKKVLLSGSQNIYPEVTYELQEDRWVKVTDKKSLNRLTMLKIEGWLDEVYTFREDHHVTEYLDDASIHKQ